MDTGDWLAVTQAQALRFFFERLRDVVGEDDVPSSELLYNASVLAHFATTSAAATSHFPGCPTSLSTVFDVFVLDRSQHVDPEIMEAAASQCLFLTGFFQDQLRRRYNLAWYASLGAGFYDSAAELGTDRARSRMMETMASRFEYWRRQQHRLAHELRDLPRLIVMPRPRTADEETSHVEKSGGREVEM
jgi:hypothetical protein